MVGSHILGQTDCLAGIGSNGQKDIIVSLQVSCMKGSRQNRNFLLLKILAQSHRAAGGVVQVEDNVFIQEIFEISLGNFGLVTIIADEADQFVIAQKFFVVDIFDIVLSTLGIRSARVGCRSGHIQRQTHFIGFPGQVWLEKPKTSRKDSVTSMMSCLFFISSSLCFG